MQHVIDELQKSLKYNNRQFNENISKIHLYEETIEDLKNRNKTHAEAMLQLDRHIEELKKAE